MARTDGSQAAVPFGEWPSPITAAEVARGTIRLAFPAARGGQVWWQEIRPDEDGRTTVVHRASGGRRRALPAPWNARTRVHEYGGLSYLPVPPRPGAGDGASWPIVFANFADQRLYLAGQLDTADPVPLTPEPPAPAAVTTGAADGAGGAVFAAAASYFGVADLVTFAAQTHDFESRYLDGLVGPLPGFEPVYRERSPLGHVTAATSPILLLQGLDDPVVPYQQSESLARELAERGITHACLMFEGESHGFRKAASITAALEAELSFYGQVMGFEPPGVPRIELRKAGADGGRTA
jgi:hypothetical protein